MQVLLLSTVFQLLSVKMSKRLCWSPATHRHFPAVVRERVLGVASAGYHVAARTLPTPAQQGAFCELWMSAVLPVVAEAFVCECEERGLARTLGRFPGECGTVGG